MSSILAYGKVTGRQEELFNNKITYIINDNSAAFTTSGSLIDRAIHNDRAGFFVVNQDGYITDYQAFGYKDHYVEVQKQRAQALKVVTERLIATCNASNSNDIKLVAGALGTAIGAAVFLSGTATVLTSIFTGDYSGTLGGMAGAAVGGVMGYVSYDSMTTAQKNIYTVCKQFEAALESYHTMCIRHAPEHMKDLPMYEPEFKAISKMLRMIFPNFGEKDLTYNKPNWAVA